MGVSYYRSMTPPESLLFPLLGAKLSISSKNITHGVAVLALANTTVCMSFVTTTGGRVRWTNLPGCSVRSVPRTY